MPIIFLKHYAERYECVNLRSHGVVIAKGSSTDCISTLRMLCSSFINITTPYRNFLTPPAAPNMLMTMFGQVRVLSILYVDVYIYTHCYWIFYVNWSTLRLLCYEIPRLTRIHFHKHLYLPLDTRSVQPCHHHPWLYIRSLRWWRSAPKVLLLLARWYWSGLWLWVKLCASGYVCEWNTKFPVFQIYRK